MKGQWAALSNGLVEAGNIFKMEIFSGTIGRKKISISALQLNCGAQIKMHEHQEESELYIPIVDEKILLSKISYCQKGRSHDLKNLGEDIMYVLSIKFHNLKKEHY